MPRRGSRSVNVDRSRVLSKEPISDSLVSAACRAANRNLTPDEWSRYFGSDKSYHRTCP